MQKASSKKDTNCTNSHEFRSTSEINWCKFVNRADGISEIEGKAPKAFGASEQGRERVSNSPATPKQAKAGVSKASPKKISIQMITLIALSRLIAMEEKPQNQKEKKGKKT